MDVMLQRHCARYIYVVPEGLRELMSDISREVLREQPEDMYTFIADYLDALLITRENARISAKFVEHISEASETIVDLLQRTGMTREEVDKTAAIIQGAFKSWSERKGILKEDEDLVVARIIEEAGIGETLVQVAAKVIQNAFKAFKMRQQRSAALLEGIIDWRVAAQSAIKLYRKTGVSPEEAKRAANLIKAAYKGYYTRRAIRLLNQGPLPDEDVDEESRSREPSASYSSDDQRKGKGVRIDYATVVPHVDFGGEERISRDLESIAEAGEKDLTPAASGDVMAQIFGDTEERKEEATYFVREILRSLVNSVVGLDEDVLTDLSMLHQKDSPIDNFVPLIEEKEEPLYNRVAPSSGLVQEELEKELKEAKQEVLKLQRGSKSSIEASSTRSSLSSKFKRDIAASKEMIEAPAEKQEERAPEGEEAQEAPEAETLPEAEAAAEVETEEPAEVQAEAAPEEADAVEPEVEIKVEEATVQEEEAPAQEEEAIKVEELAVEEPQAQGDIQEETVD